MKRNNVTKCKMLQGNLRKSIHLKKDKKKKFFVSTSQMDQIIIWMSKTVF